LAGYSIQNQSYHAKTGVWERHGWGIFRYKYYPHLPGDRPDLIVATLWSCGRDGSPQGVISHDTALSFHKLSTWSGSGVHMTVPEQFRRRSRCEFKVRLHRGQLETDDIEDMGSFRITTPLRTILDLLRSTHIERIHIVDAMNDALRRQLFTHRQLKKAASTLEEKAMLIEILQRIKYPKINEI
jgi:predicted transcriptional regulator of viral defense system